MSHDWPREVAAPGSPVAKYFEDEVNQGMSKLFSLTDISAA